MQFRRPVGFWGMYMRSNQRRGEAGAWRISSTGKPLSPVGTAPRQMVDFSSEKKGTKRKRFVGGENLRKRQYLSGRNDDLYKNSRGRQSIYQH
jgi:hypothetical protein